MNDREGASMHAEFRAFSKGCVALALTAAVAVGGCGLSGSDVELNGGVFDLLGISASSPTRGGEPKMAPRAGIVLPPSDNRLPPPGAPAETASIPDPAWPDDPDQKKVRTAEQRDRQQAEFCRRQEMEAKTTPNAILPNGPNGPCQKSILGTFGLFGTSN